MNGREVLVEKVTDILSVKDSRKFEVECYAGDAGELRVGAELVSVKVGQRLRTKEGEEIWHSVVVLAQEDEEGALVVRALVIHPDWKDPLQITSVKSRPQDGMCKTPLGCNLDHVAP